MDDLPLYLTLGITFGIIGLLVFRLLFNYFRVKFRTERVSGNISLLKSAVDQLTRLTREKGQIDLGLASKILDIPVLTIKTGLYSLIGENKIDGRFEQDIFIPTSNLEEFLHSIEEIFIQARANEVGQAGKSKKV